MNNFILMGLCFIAGVVLSKTGKAPVNAHQGINTIIVYISLPALTLLNLHHLSITNAFVMAATTPWILFVVGAAFFFVIGKWLDFSKSTIGALTLVGGLGNTSFVGVPMIEALQGPFGIPIALVMDQAGSYMVLSTLGMLAVSIYCSATSDLASIAKRIVTFPPFIALCLALLLINVDYPLWAEVTLKRLGDMLAPLALLSVGMQMRTVEVTKNKKALAVGLGYKLVACPVIILGFMYLSGVRIDSFSTQVIVLEAAMGPSIGAGIVASQHDLNPALVTLMVGVGIPLCLFTVPLLSNGLRWAGM